MDNYRLHEADLCLFVAVVYKKRTENAEEDKKKNDVFTPNVILICCHIFETSSWQNKQDHNQVLLVFIPWLGLKNETRFA